MKTWETIMGKNKTYFVTNICFAIDNSSIDEGNGILRGVVAISAGEAKGHGMVIDGVMLDQVVAAGNKSRNGIKSRFGHPELFGSSIGSMLGRFRNFRRNGDDVVADLHLSEASKKSPKGNLWEYVIALARSDADMCGMSIAFSQAPSEMDGAGCEHCRLESLDAVDLVDEPAATCGMFDQKSGQKIFNILTTKEKEIMADTEMKTELDNAKIELAGLRVKVEEFAKQIEAKEIENIKSKEEYSKKESEKQAEIDAIKSQYEGKISELSEKLAAVEAGKAKVESSEAAIRAELSVFKNGAAPMPVKASDEPPKRKSIFKNLS